MDTNVRAKTFLEWSGEKSKDPRFLYGVYRQLDAKGIFPPGMDKYSVETAPCFVKMAASGFVEGPTVMAIIKKIVGAYERELIRQWDKRDSDREKEQVAG